MLEHIFIPFKDTKQFESTFTPQQYLLIHKTGIASPKYVIQHFSKIIAPKSTWNYSIFKRIKLNYHGKVDELGFNIIPITNRGPPPYYQGKFVLNDTSITQILVTAKIPVWWLLFYSIFSLLLLYFPSIIISEHYFNGSYFYLTYTLTTIFFFFLLYSYHRWIRKHDLIRLKKDLIRITRISQFKE